MKTIMLLGAATLVIGGAATAQMTQPSGTSQGQTGASAPAATTAAPANGNDQATTADPDNSSDKIAAAREKAKKDKAQKDKAQKAKTKDQKTDGSTTPQ